MRLAAPAKLNLHLRVGPPRPDGFHPLLTWMCTVGLFDELELEKGDITDQAGTKRDTTLLQYLLLCDDPAIPTGEENLMVRAAMDLGVPARMKLYKRIPPGGGLAGGSSDAAATLVGLNKLWNLGRTAAQLAESANRLGSDIAFFLSGPSSVCSGRGDVVRPIGRPSPKWALLILPPYPMATPQVYRRFDEMRLGRLRDVEEQPDWSRWTQLPAMELLPLLVNDLEAPAFDLNPALAKLRDQWEERLGRPVRMSGSGSTLFTLFDEKLEAEKIIPAASGPEFLRLVELGPNPIIP